MRPSLRIACFALLAACGPKVDPIGPIDGTLDPDPASDTPTDAVGVTGTAGKDGGTFRWEGDFGNIELADGLAGQPVTESKAGGWETRSTRNERRSTSASRGYGGPAGGAVEERVTLGALGYVDDLGVDADVTVAAAPSRPRSAPKAKRASGRAMPSREAAPAPMMDAPVELAMEESYDHGGDGMVAGGMGGLATRGDRAASVDSYRSRPVPTQPALKAGTTDDNADFDGWLSYVSEWGARGDISGWADSLDVSGRRHVQVLDARGRPVPDARVSIMDPTSERVVWAGRGYGDGRVPMYPQLKVPGRAIDIAGDAPAGGWLVQAATSDGAVRTVRWDGQGEELDVVVDTDGLKAGAPVPVDVCFIIDTTGSMGDEISRIKSTLLSVTDKLRADAAQGVDLRYGAVLYRDIGDEYVTRRHAFTADLEGFDSALKTISAAGGGDGPESLNQGLAVGVAGMDWREGAARVAFVIADAPPHMDYQEDVTYGRAAAAAAHRGIRVHTVAASGLDDRGSYAFRQVAQLTRGQFIYIEYGSSSASAADHGVAGPTASNNLDDIVYGRVRAEIDGWGKDGTMKVARR